MKLIGNHASHNRTVGTQAALRVALGLLLLAGAMAPTHATAQDIPICPAVMPPLGFSKCEIVLENGHLEDRPRGSVSNNPVWNTLPGWQINGPVHMGTIWQRQNAVSTAAGLDPGRWMAQTVPAPRTNAIPGSPLPTYELHFSASPLAEMVSGRLTARLIGVTAGGDEKELAHLDVEPRGAQLEKYRIRASPYDVPASIRVEFGQAGHGERIYVDHVGILQLLQ